MTYTEAHTRATILMAEAWAVWADSDIERLLALGHSRKEAVAIQNSHISEVKECIGRNIARLTRLLLDPSAPGRLQ